MEKRWTIAEKAEQTEVTRLSQELNNLNETLCELLIKRGLSNFGACREFFRPDLSQLHDPFLMKDMALALDRLLKAIDSKEKILIYGDYDVDGTTSVALVYSYLSNYYDQLDYYIPDRYAEGYGVSFQGIDYAESNDISLIIALDCGIKAVDKIDYAAKKKIDFIICDHHLPGEQLPKAIAVLDPKRSDCTYPFKELSGCGVGFKLMQAFAKKQGLPEQLLFEKLDILAVSICADIVPIVGENRVLTHFGLKKLNEKPQEGFKAMLELANNKNKSLTVMDVVFTIAPRINAAGRIKTGKKAVEVMLSADAQIATEGGASIDQNNSDRKVIDKSITEQALQMIEADEVLKQQKTTVLFDPSWHKGVIGIVASRCIENYYRPTIILTESNGKASGSARSVKGFSVYDALEKCSDLLEQFGGHKYAAGMTLKKENIPAFQAKFEEVVAASIADDLLIPELEIDAEIKLSEISPKFYKVLKQFAPFGPKNMKPNFIAKNLLEKGSARIVGNNHVKLDFYDPKNQGTYYPAIAFNLGDKLELIRSGKALDVVFTIEENEWNNKITLQLNVKDLRESES